MITITESAQSKIKEVLEDETPETRLRMYVTGGGCSGFQYGFSLWKKVKTMMTLKFLQEILLY